MTRTPDEAEDAHGTSGWPVPRPAQGNPPECNVQETLGDWEGVTPVPHRLLFWSSKQSQLHRALPIHLSPGGLVSAPVS